MYQIVEFWIGKSIKPSRILEFANTLFNNITRPVPNSIFEGKEDAWDEGEESEEEGKEEKEAKSFPETEEFDAFSDLLVHHQFAWRSVEEIQPLPLKAPKREKTSARRNLIESKVSKQKKSEDEHSYSDTEDSSSEEEGKLNGASSSPQLDELDEEELKAIFQSRLAVNFSLFFAVSP